MSKSDFVPIREADFMVWHDNLKEATQARNGTVGIVAADLTALAEKNTTVHETIAAAAELAARAEQAVEEKNDALKDAEQHARKFAKRIKLHVDYNQGIGDQMGIEGPEDTTDMASEKPTLKAKAHADGSVELKFSKSKSDGVNIYSMRDGETQFVFLTRDTNSPYVDNRPCAVMSKPEIRHYKAIYILDDQEVGLFSDQVSVTCQP